ncbi:DUF3073 domain-containing protein [Alloscardovia omnicolens]|jgi:hypothetical protein|uniref:DUF3073 domain-containing protein n=2 Tax=Alloscardovia omnicolens TaxID=419015 RepID=U1SLZ7_9BIFI|nr:DUF3073 domain-containing protein [Alloscardovia omnicolens]ERH31712.1 hypothetical protein HMPREF9244_00147 [Alloscardovia omnicolens F0580]KWZ75816.1 hypothetical protein HMPREF3214_00238 [Alloscardovia omnicolens]MBS6345890.1 DUF3073 domain-containing protein [Alloscardovia omnicolens]MDK6250076.1 DUF3073 domain-containing protein [Alloscardovia omnicolens]MDK6251316.1 DUF3073 domain-containing protein [Alloscardovia omnicolens]
MGRGRQKAKQTKIARKLKYLTTDTDYDELAKELSHHDDAAVEAETDVDVDVDVADDTSQGDLDDYAAWAAQAAKRAEGKPAAQPVAHKPFPKMPVPGIKKKD